MAGKWVVGESGGVVRNPVAELREQGQVVWIDELSREMIESGALARLRDRLLVTGVTSSPTIFQKALEGDGAYRWQREKLEGEWRTSAKVGFELALTDVQMAAEILQPVYEESRKRDGYVSMEVEPKLAYDQEGTIRRAKEMFERIGRPNGMIKIPATRAGLGAMEEALFAGVNVNITLLFSLTRYREVVETYLRALERRAEAGLSLEVFSVASFFVSRVDMEVDRRLRELGGLTMVELLGKAGIANARLAYLEFERAFYKSERFLRLQRMGAGVQKPLWASTSTKNPALPKTRYVETLIGRDTISSMPITTLQAFVEQGVVKGETVREGRMRAKQVSVELTGIGIYLEEVAEDLLEAGVSKFDGAYEAVVKQLGGVLV